MGSILSLIKKTPQKKYYIYVDEEDVSKLIISSDKPIYDLLQLPIVWNILCRYHRNLKFNIVDDNFYLIEEDEEDDEIHRIYKIFFEQKVRRGFYEYTTSIVYHRELSDVIKWFIKTYLPKSIELAIKYAREKNDLNSLALASSGFDPEKGYFNGYDTDATELDENELKRQRLTGKIDQSLKNNAINRFAEHYYPDIIRKVAGSKIDLNEKDKNENELRKMNRLFSEQYRLLNTAPNFSTKKLLRSRLRGELQEITSTDDYRINYYGRDMEVHRIGEDENVLCYFVGELDNDGEDIIDLIVSNEEDLEECKAIYGNDGWEDYYVNKEDHPYYRFIR